MKTIGAAMILVLTAALPAAAVPAAAAPSPAIAGRYTCENQGLSRVVFKAEPAPCCTGAFGCPQLLANTGLVKPKRSNRT